KMKIKPFKDRIVVKLLKADKIVSGGSIVNDTAEKSYRGEVIAVGDGKMPDGSRLQVNVKGGSQICFAKYSGTAEIEFKGEKFFILKEADILKVFDATFSPLPGESPGQDYPKKRKIKPFKDSIVVKLLKA